MARDQLEEIELHMLQAQSFPRLLKVEWLELDGQISFHYKLSGKRMLSQRIHLRPFTMNDYYALLLAVVEALEDCKHYMLRAEGVLLHENYIFVGEEWEDIGLVYVPIRKEETSRTVREDLLSLAVRWTAHVEQVDGNGLQMVLHALDGEGGGGWAAMRSLLLEKLSEPYRIETSFSSAPVEMKGDPIRPFEPLEFYSIPEERHADAFVPAVSVIEDKPERDLGRFRWYAAAITVVAIAALWRYLYLEAPSGRTAMISAGSSLIVLGTVYAAWRWILHRQAAPAELAAVPVPQEEMGRGQQAPRWSSWSGQEPHHELDAPDSQFLPKVPKAAGLFRWDLQSSLQKPL
ncbi:DUF6382 domain-containing protein [Paenibacillus abyssi]|uniref:DUF6382 domain-containing protein n=1 Tax=Paenibacillus abyssi TaxID=1340531 RepID=UPI00360C0FF9